MTVPITASASNLTNRYGNRPVDCGAAQVQVHCRPLATVVTVRGTIDAVNVDQVSEYARRFIRVKNPLVLDLSGVNSFAAVGISLVHNLDEDCRSAGLDWTLVTSPAVIELLRDHDGEAILPITHSLNEALYDLADGIAKRRQLLLPLIRKTA